MADQEMLALLATNLQAMYHGTDAAQRRSADAFLQKLQREASGWGLADAILGGRTPFASGPGDLASNALGAEAVTFASMTLHAKVSGDLHELSPEQAVSLRGAALDHLARWSGVGVPGVVVKKLGLTVAALAVSTSWDGALDFVREAFGREEADAAQGMRTKVVAVELLAALPEQCAWKELNVPLSRREAYTRYLCQSSEGVLGVLTQLVVWAAGAAAGCPAGAEQLNGAVFGCLKSWISFCDIKAEHLASSALFTGVRRARHGPLEHACDVIVEALRRFDCRLPENGVLVAAIAPRVMALEARFAARRRSEDDDEAMGLCRIFCEMGEAYMPMIASERDCNQLAIVSVMIKCTEYPARRVAAAPLRFWYHLARAVGRLADGDPARASLVAKFRDAYASLARLCVRLSVREEHDVDAADPRLDGDDFSSHRCDLFDAFGDAAYFLGADAVLAAVAEEVQLATGANATCDGVEACLFALTALSDFVPDAEAFVLPSACSMVCALPRDWRRARDRGSVFVGAYALWLAAARRSVVLPDELEILEGLGALVAAMPDYEAVRAGTEQLAGPPALALTAIASSNAAGEPRVVARELDRLTSVVRYASPPAALLGSRPHPVLELFDKLWPVFEALGAKYRESTVVVEKLCRCYKHAMRSCRKAFAPMLSRMAAHLVQSFASNPISSFIYCSSICITEFGDEAEKRPALFDMFASLSSAVFGLLSTPEAYAAAPDVVEEYFYLASRFLDHCPEPLLESPLLAALLRAATAGLAVEHREALRGVLHCCDRFASTAIRSLQRAGGPLPPAVAHCEPPLSRGDAPQSQQDVDDARRHAATLHGLLVVEASGAALTDGLLKALSGDLPSYIKDEGRGSLLGVLWKLRLVCPPESFAAWCSTSLAVITDKFASHEITNDLLKSVAVEPPRKDHFYDAFAVFARCFSAKRKMKTRRSGRR
ncbi:hypothetical protein JL722_212 [Aureococcus anophagefferens]|nr:hypothetical protein JL722_212 [Aureococcus anophagefferens]